MNNALVGIYGVISSVEERTVVYGVPVSATGSTVVSVSVGESTEQKGYFGNADNAVSATVEVSVYSTDYLTGYNLLNQIKTEIIAAGKQTTKVVYAKDKASGYDKELQKHVFTAQYKELN